MLKENYKQNNEKMLELSNNLTDYKNHRTLELSQKIKNNLSFIKKQVENAINQEIKTPLGFIKIYKNILQVFNESNFNLEETNIQKITLSVFYGKMNDFLENLYISMLLNQKNDDLIRNICCFIKLDSFFNDTLFFNILKRHIVKKFVFHFLSGRKSDRLDCPHICFDFLLEQYKNCVFLLEAYVENHNEELSIIKIITDILESCQNECVLKKAEQIDVSNSKQKRNLMINFLNSFRKYKKKVYEEYEIKLSDKEIGKKLKSMVLMQAHEDLDNLHSQNFMLWFDGYMEILKDLSVIQDEYGSIVDIEKVLEMIVFYLHEYSINLNFVNRSEIEMICFFYTKAEELKYFVDLELSCDGGCIVELQLELIELTNTLVKIDCEKSTKLLGSFIYVTPENKKSFLVKITNDLNTYKGSSRFEEIETNFIEYIDRYFVERVITKYKMEKEDFENFKTFFLKVKGVFRADKKWITENGIDMIISLFNGSQIEGTSLGNVINTLYLYE